MADNPEIPDTGGLSTSDFLKQYGAPGHPAGTSEAVQPPPDPMAGTSSTLGRYGRAALQGAYWSAPVAAAELGIGATTGPGVLAAVPAALGTEVVGALSGVAGEAANDLFPNTPWAGPVASGIVGLAGGGMNAAGAGIRAGVSGITGLFTHTIGGQVAVGDILAHMVTNGSGAAAHLTSLIPAAAAAATMYPLYAAYQGVRRIAANPTAIESYMKPMAGLLAGEGNYLNNPNVPADSFLAHPLTSIGNYLTNPRQWLGP